MARPDEAVWLGGATGSGKTTVARAFASRHGLRVFPVDAFWYSHQRRRSDARRTPDGQWLEQTPAEQAAEFERLARDRWRLVLDDLTHLPARPPVIVEGPQILPDLVPAGAAAVFLVATAAFQRTVLMKRPLPTTADARQALENRIEKDRLFGLRVVSLAAAREFPVVLVDGSRSADDILAVVEQHVGNSVATDADTAALKDARRWENRVVADNIASWLASPDAPEGDPGTFPFACECGGRGCAAQLYLSLAQYRGMSDVVADVHRE